MLIGIKKINSIWSTYDLQLKLLVALLLSLVVFAYIPSIQFDYAIGDQWRAFRYPESYSRIKETLACAHDSLAFYVRSGRPLVWLGECFERGAVSTINQFWILRFIPLVIALIIVLYMGQLLALLTKKPIVGYLTSSVLVLTPGFAFMVQLGTNGAPVLLSILLALASFSKVNNVTNHSKNEFLKDKKEISYSFLLFFIACLIYPAWAFIVMPLMFLFFFLEADKPLEERFKKLFFIFLFYLISATLYFAFVKASVWLNLFGSAVANMGDGRYEVSINWSIDYLINRIAKAFLFMAIGEIWDQNLRFPMFLSGLIAFIFITRNYLLTNLKSNIFAYTLSLLIVLPVGILMLSASIAPWIFSGMPEYQDRFFLVAYLLPILLLFFSLAVAAEKFSFTSKYWIYIAFFSCVLVSIAVNRITYLNVTASVIRTDFIRTEIEEWINSKSYISKKIILLIPPYSNNNEARPAFIRRLLDSPSSSKIGLWSGDINHYFEVLSAILRERSDHPVGRELELVNCALDNDCLIKNIEAGRVVFYLLNRSDMSKSDLILPQEPFIINVSSLTANPVSIGYKVLPTHNPSISTSSQLHYLSAFGLFKSQQPGWHAEKNPKYPQTITVDFKEIKSFSNLAFLPQDNHKSRMPKKIRLKISNDGHFWSDYSAFDNLCSSNSDDQWHAVNFAKKIETRFLQISILENCGDTKFLTLKGLRVE